MLGNITNRKLFYGTGFARLGKNKKWPKEKNRVNPLYPL